MSWTHPCLIYLLFLNFFKGRTQLNTQTHDKSHCFTKLSTTIAQHCIVLSAKFWLLVCTVCSVCVLGFCLLFFMAGVLTVAELHLDPADAASLPSLAPRALHLPLWWTAPNQQPVERSPALNWRALCGGLCDEPSSVRGWVHVFHPGGKSEAALNNTGLWMNLENSCSMADSCDSLTTANGGLTQYHTCSYSDRKCSFFCAGMKLILTAFPLLIACYHIYDCIFSV